MTRESILFVCHANQCRSPLAEAIFLHHARARRVVDRFEVDSAGTWASDGIPPHPGSVTVGEAHGIDVKALSGRSRAIVPEDLARFDHIIAMDRDNEDDVLRLRRISAFGEVEGGQARVRLLRHVTNPGTRGREADVPDPVRKGAAAFESAYALIEAGCLALLDELTQ